MISSHVSGPLALIAVAGVLAGCASPGVHVNIPSPDGSQPTASRTAYFKGDVFTFNDKVSGKNSTFVVDGSTGSAVRWQGGPNLVMETSVEPPLPWMRLHTDTVQIDRKLVEGSTFPLRPGRRNIKLEVDTRIAQKGDATLAFRESYHCDIGAWESLVTQAGTYRAIPIQCTKYISGDFPPSGYLSFRAGKTISWYAPDAGHVVRQVEMDKRFVVTKDLWLTDHRASLAALPAGQREQVSRELEAFAKKPPKEGEKTWRFPASAVELTAKMDNSQALSKSVGCRPYTIDINRSGARQVLHRQACS
jgi:hypothetical protein